MAPKKKKIAAQIKLQAPAGQATPAPPIGPALGPHGVSAPQFVQQFNDQTKSMEKGLIIPVVITVYSDRSYDFILKSPPAAVLLKKAAGVESGSARPHQDKVGTVSRAKVAEIAKLKMNDLNATTEEAAFSIIAGTARSMGITVEEQ